MHFRGWLRQVPFLSMMSADQARRSSDVPRGLRRARALVGEVDEEVVPRASRRFHEAAGWDHVVELVHLTGIDVQQHSARWQTGTRVPLQSTTPWATIGAKTGAAVSIKLISCTAETTWLQSSETVQVR